MSTNTVNTTNTVVRARIDEQTKEEASIVLSAIGLTLSDAFRMLLIRIAREKALPFEPLVPNSETIEAIKLARSGDTITVGSIDNLLTQLNSSSNTKSNTNQIQNESIERD